MYTPAGCTCAGLDGRTSAICTHLSSVKCVATISYVYSTSPRAGICTAFGIFTIASGCAIFHPSLHLCVAGASRISPADAPLSAHAVNVEIWPAVNDGSFEKYPYRGSANHGGIIFISTAAAIFPAFGRVCSYVTSGIGAGSPVRWQLWHLSWWIGRTSL